MADSPDPEIQFRDRNQDVGQGDAESATETEDLPHGRDSPARRHRSTPIRVRSRSPFRRYRGRSPNLPPRPHPRYSSASPDNGPDFSPYRGSRSPDRRAQKHGNSDASWHYQGPTLKPDPYSGQENWEEYISHFENCADLCQWDHRQKVLMLAASFRGQARTFYMSLSHSEKANYRLLVSTLYHRFGSSRHQNRWLAKLEMRRREPGESIAAVGDDIRQMAQKAYCNLDPLAQEALALNQLYKVVSLEMKCRCIDRDCTSVSEAVDVIERYEAIMGDNSDRKKSNMRTIDSSPVRRESHQQSKLESTLERIEARLDRLEKHAQFNPKPAPQQQTYPKQSGGGQKPTKRTCFTCSSPHHMYRNCPYNNPNFFYQQNPMPSYNPESRNANQGNGNQSSL